jgi:hypothetical protein
MGYDSSDEVEVGVMYGGGGGGPRTPEIFKLYYNVKIILVI